MRTTDMMIFLTPSERACILANKTMLGELDNKITQFNYLVHRVMEENNHLKQIMAGHARMYEQQLINDRYQYQAALQTIANVQEAKSIIQEATDLFIKGVQLLADIELPKSDDDGY